MVYLFTYLLQQPATEIESSHTLHEYAMPTLAVK